MTGLLVMLNNYFHDLASGLLLVSAFVMFSLLKGIDKNTGKDAVQAYIFIYNKLRVFVALSLVWIVAGGAVRTWAYRAYEWSDAAGRGQVPALVAKHIIFLLLLAAGVHYWRLLGRRIKEISGGTPGEPGGDRGTG